MPSFLIKGVSIAVGFFTVPLCLSYIDQSRYGVWITISSILTWFSFFEIGLGHGLKNRLAEALAVEDYQLGKKYVSTTYALLIMIITCVGVLFVIANYFFIDWTIVF